MHITVIGATGFIGQAVIKTLLTEGKHSVTGFSKSVDRLTFQASPATNYTAVAGDLFNPTALAKALKGCDVVIYLVHMMGSKHDDYAKLEAEGAHMLAQVAKRQNVKRVIFLGGLGDDTTILSKHLASRQRTGEILRSQLPLVIELRASMIIGSGSVGYEIIKAIANKLPVTAIPRWANTKTQPIALSDAIDYVLASIELITDEHLIIGIGGPEVLTYPQILERYTAWTGHRHHVFIVPGVPRWAATVWLQHYTSRKSAGIGKPMVESLHHEMIVTDSKAKELFPTIQPVPIEAAFV